MEDWNNRVTGRANNKGETVLLSWDKVGPWGHHMTERSSRESKGKRHKDSRKGPSPSGFDKDNLRHKAPDPAGYIQEQQAMYIIEAGRHQSERIRIKGRRSREEVHAGNTQEQYIIGVITEYQTNQTHNPF